MTDRIPLVAVPAQSLTITLGLQRCQIAVYQKSTGLYFDLFLAGLPVAVGVLCCNRTNLVRNKYTAFVGNLAFIDTMGSLDPDYTGLASRFRLVYVP